MSTSLPQHGTTGFVSAQAAGSFYLPTAHRVLGQQRWPPTDAATPTRAPIAHDEETRNIADTIQRDQEIKPFPMALLEENKAGVQVPISAPSRETQGEFKQQQQH